MSELTMKLMPDVMPYMTMLPAAIMRPKRAPPIVMIMYSVIQKTANDIIQPKMFIRYSFTELYE